MISDTRMVHANVRVERKVVTVQAGFNCTLSCKTDNNASVAWHYTAPSQSPQSGFQIPFLYNGFNFKDNFSANYAISRNFFYESSQSNLHIISAKLNHAGTYTCEQSKPSGSAALEFIVIGELIGHFVLWIN